MTIKTDTTGILNFRQRKFIECYTDPDRPTFLRGPDSMRQLNPRLTSGSARSGAYDMLHNPLVEQTVKEILEKAGFGIEDRAAKLADLVNHPAIGKSITQTVRAGGTTQVVHYKGPGYGDVLRAIDLADKAERPDERRREVAAAAAEYRALSARFFPHKGDKPTKQADS